MQYRKHPLTGEWIIHQQQTPSPDSSLYASFSWDGTCMPLHKKLRSCPMQEMNDGDFLHLFQQYHEWIEQIHAICPQACIPSILDPHAGLSADVVSSQMIAFPPDKLFVDASVKRAQLFYREHKKCLWCAMIDQELESAQRLVTATGDYVIFEPYTARFPFETYILPRNHIHSFDATSHELLDTLAQICARYIPVIHEAAGQADFAVFLHHASVADCYKELLHWYLQIIPFMNTWAGFEIATAMNINVSTPEDCAAKISQKNR